MTSNPGPQPASDGRTLWRIDPARSTVGFSARHMMLTTVKGLFTNFDGTIHADEQSPTNSSVEVTLQVTSINTGMDSRDEALRSADFLDVQRFPTITFRSTRITGDKDHFKLMGDMTIRGVTRPVTFNVTFEGIAKDPKGSGDLASFTASGTIDRRDFGLTWSQALEAGGILVSNDIKLLLDIHAVRST